MIKKKGFTLVELIITIALITVTLVISTFSIKVYKEIQLEAKYEEMRIGMLNFFDMASLYCSNNNINAHIRVHIGDSKVTLSNGEIIFMTYSIDALEFKDVINQSNRIEINYNGEIKGSGTVNFVFKDKIEGELVITAITNNVKVRKK